jgi:hypothetical protein
MSFETTRNQPIEPFKLVQESFGAMGPVYLPLLILNTPAAILGIAQTLTQKFQIGKGGWPQAEPTTLSHTIAAFSFFVILPIFTAVMIYFIYRYLKDGTFDLNGCARRGLSKGLYSIIGMIAYAAIVTLGLLLLILPGIYLSVLFSFFLYAIVSEEYNLVDSFKYSAELVRGRWWQVFGALLVGALCLIPIFLVITIIGVIVGAFMGASGLELTSIMMISSVVGILLGTLFNPFLNIFYVKLYAKLQETQRSRVSL